MTNHFTLPDIGYGLTGGVIQLDPLTARNLSENHDSRNRDRLRRQVETLSEEIKADSWALNGSTITFDVNGTVVDGGHRLAAIAHSGRTVPVLVVQGLSPDVRNTVDKTVPRKLHHAFQIAGIENAKRASDLVSVVLKAESGSDGYVDPDNAIEFYREHASKVADIAENSIPAGITSSQAVLLFLWQIGAGWLDEARVFLEQVADKMPASSAAFATRKALQDGLGLNESERGLVRGARNLRGKVFVAGLLGRGFEKHIRGETVSRLSGKGLD